MADCNIYIYFFVNVYIKDAVTWKQRQIFFLYCDAHPIMIMETFSEKFNV